LPGFVKSFIQGATGLKPHIFQVSRFKKHVCGFCC
jgi:hypothetical protein